MLKKSCFVILGLFLLGTGSFLFPRVSIAEDQISKSTPLKDSKVDLGALGPSGPGGAPARKIEHTYTQVSYINLYKLAWSYDAFSLRNEEDLNVYLIISECNLYQKFFLNEFKWEKIKNSTRDFIDSNRQKVPRYYEYVQPIFMGRYDYALQGFPILDAKNFKGQKNLQFANYVPGETSCARFDLDVAKYPATGVLTIPNPLNLAFIRVPLNLAQKYVEWRSKQGHLQDKERQAYIRYRIRIDGYDGIKKYSSGVNAFNFNGKLMRLDVFADKELLLPLYNQVF